MSKMQQTVASTAFVLLIVGTVGLLLNEFVFDWGTTATLSLAAMNLIGLVLLGIAYIKNREVQGT